MPNCKIYVYGYDVTHDPVFQKEAGYLGGKFTESFIREPGPDVWIRVHDVKVNYRPWGVLPKLRTSCLETGAVLAIPFVADVRSTSNLVASICHRFGTVMPVVQRARARSFMNYCTSVVRLLFTPLSCDTLVDIDSWFERSPYSMKKKQNMYREYENASVLTKKIMENGQFGKREGFMSWKTLRSILCPKDIIKMILGPLTHSIEKQVLHKLDWFVKGTDPKKLPGLLLEMFGEDPVIETDFTSFEANQRGVYSEVFLMFMKYMTDSCGLSQVHKDVMEHNIIGVNMCKSKHIDIVVKQRLMSGAVWTSLQNSITNFFIMSYLYINSTFGDPVFHYEHVKQFRGIFEGDDGITKAFDVDERVIQELGLRLKFDKKNNFADAHFCGIRCDLHELTVMTDPRKILCSFHLLGEEYINASDKTHNILLRAKALSYMYLYNSCPVIGAFCHKICDLTRDLDVRKHVSAGGDAWHGPFPFVQLALKQKIWTQEIKPTLASRLFMESKFFISVHEQTMLEEQIKNSVRGIQVTARHLFGNDQLNFTEKYTSYSDREEIAQGPLPKIVTRVYDGAYCAKSKTKHILHISAEVDIRFKSRDHSLPDL